MAIAFWPIPAPMPIRRCRTSTSTFSAARQLGGMLKKIRDGLDSNFTRVGRNAGSAGRITKCKDDGGKGEADERA